MKSRGIQLIDMATDGTPLDLKIQPERDDTGQILRGLVIGDTLQQNKALILLAHPGSFRGDPALGVGINDMLLDDDLLPFRHRIREHFAMDGMKVHQLQLYAGKPIIIHASYED